MKPKKKRKYFRKCGLCGKRAEQSEMIRDNGSPNGWFCRDCDNTIHAHEYAEIETEEF